MNDKALAELLAKLLGHGRETEWIEFKRNYANPEDIGAYLSALSNSAALNREQFGYLVWGVADDNLGIVGTNFRPHTAKKGNEELQNWLFRLLEPKVDFKIHEFDYDDKRVVIFEVQAAELSPVRFAGDKFIRIGSSKKRLREFPQREKELWKILSETPFENGIALAGITSDEVLQLINYTECFRLLEFPLPDNRAGILEKLSSERVIVDRGAGVYDVTNAGAILFTAQLGQFDRLSRKALRVIQYAGKNRVETVREQLETKGYAVGFEGAMRYVNDLLPQNEQIGQALRKSVPVYPEIAIRELVANALIHQDFSLTGTGPMIEVFSDRIEVTNPGNPLIDPLRFIDEPPRSRNEGLAAMMRRMNICEERGSGIDKVIFQVELFQLPAPDFVVTDGHTKVVLLAPKRFGEMDQRDRIRACYQHACLRYVSNAQMNNTSFRERLGVEQNNYSIASRVIRDTIDAGLIRAVDPTTSNRYMKYVPFWA